MVDDGRYRTPRYGAFLATGAVLGVLAALAVAWFGAADTARGGQDTYLYFAVVGAFLGAIVLCGVAVVVEKVANRGRTDPLRRDRDGGTGRRPAP